MILPRQTPLELTHTGGSVTDAVASYTGLISNTLQNDIEFIRWFSTYLPVRTGCVTRVWIIHMTRQAFEEEAGLYDASFLVRNKSDSSVEQSLEGLPDSRVILFETGQAVAAALGAGVFLAWLAQWAGLR